MKYTLLITILLFPILLFAVGKKEVKPDEKQAAYLVTASEVNKVLILNNDAQIIRKIDARNTYDAWILANEDILFNVNHGIKIINTSDEIVFQYQSEHEVYACQPIGKNRFLIGECSAGRLIEIDKKGKIRRTIPLTFKHGGHTCFRGARKLENGNYLVSHYSDKTVREYDKDGTVIQEFVRSNAVYSAQRLKNGNTVVSDQFSISIFNQSAELIWEFNSKEHPELGVYHLTGFQYLENGEIIVCNWLGHAPYHKGIPIFKVNQNKEIIWKFHNAQETYSCTNIQLLN